MLVFAWLALHTCSLFPRQGTSRAWESGNRASFEQNTVGACVSRENTGALLEGPLSGLHHLEKENIAACMDFSEARGLAFKWFRTGDEGTMGTGAQAPFAVPSPQPLH